MKNYEKKIQKNTKNKRNYKEIPRILTDSDPASKTGILEYPLAEIFLIRSLENFSLLLNMKTCFF